MEVYYYTDEELSLLREQKRRANAEAMAMWEKSGVTLDPRVREAREKLKK